MAVEPCATTAIVGPISLLVKVLSGILVAIGIDEVDGNATMATLDVLVLQVRNLHDHFCHSDDDHISREDE